MTISPQDIENQVFKERFRGYDQEEVDAFLQRLSERLREVQRERDDALDRVAVLERGAADGADSDRLLKRTLLAAERTADQAVAEATAEAEQLLADARAEAQTLLGSARSQADAVREEARREATREWETARAGADQVRRAVDEFRSFGLEYKERVQAVIAEQLAALDRAGDLPELPAAIEQLGTLEAAGPDGSPGAVHHQ